MKLNFKNFNFSFIGNYSLLISSYNKNITTLFEYKKREIATIKVNQLSNVKSELNKNNSFALEGFDRFGVRIEEDFKNKLIIN